MKAVSFVKETEYPGETMAAPPDTCTHYSVCTRMHSPDVQRVVWVNVPAAWLGGRAGLHSSLAALVPLT